MLGRTDRRLRIVVLLLLFGAFALAAVARLGYWQIARGAELQTMAIQQQTSTIEQQAVRGQILDRNGVVLATTAFRDTLAAYPDQISEGARQGFVDALTPILVLTEPQRVDLLTRLACECHYLVLSRELSEAQSQQVREAVGKGSLQGVVLEPHPKRLYPNPGGAPGTTLASQLIGFVTSEGKGNYGVEQHYDSILAGRPKLMAALRDAEGRPLQSTATVLDPGADGQNIHLTIDASLQLQLEKELYAAWVADRAHTVSAIIMDPANGEVLAWGSEPSYDANDYASIAATNPAILQDPLVSQVYEPGSVMKMFTATAALKNHIVTPTSVVQDQARMRFGGTVISNSDNMSMGKMKFRDAIAYSRNLATAGVALRLDKNPDKAAAKLYAAWKLLGIGSLTGMDVAGEIPGLAPDPAKVKWQQLDLANRAFGQGVAVTQVQLAAGYATMANGGYRVTPHVLASIADQPAAAIDPERVLDASLAGQLKGILHHVTASVPWYAEGSLIPGYEVGGKTGTAQIWDAAAGAYTRNEFNLSFNGFAGGDTPRALISVRIGDVVPAHVNKPGDLEWGITSYQLFHRIAVDTLQRLGVAPASSPDAGYPEHGTAAERSLYPDRYAAWKASRENDKKGNGNQHGHSGGRAGLFGG